MKRYRLDYDTMDLHSKGEWVRFRDVSNIKKEMVEMEQMLGKATSIILDLEEKFGEIAYWFKGNE